MARFPTARHLEVHRLLARSERKVEEANKLGRASQRHSYSTVLCKPWQI